MAPDVVAAEIVGPLAIADLVAVRFDEAVIAARQRAGIGVTDDLLVLRVLRACRRTARTVGDLAHALGLSQSSVRRAVRVGHELGALTPDDGRRHRTHPAWGPAGRRLVAVELKRTDWRRAADQAWAYQTWANAAWLILGQVPPGSAVQALANSGIGVAYLGADARVHVLLRARSRKHAPSDASVWAAEQALLRAPVLNLGLRPTAIRGCAKASAAPVALAG